MTRAEREAILRWREERIAEKKRGEVEAARKLKRLPRHKRFEIAKRTTMGLALIRAGLI